MKKIHMKFLMLILLIFLLPTNVFATNEITLKTDKQDLEIGDEFTVTAQMSSDAKMYALTATLSYDHSVFEAIDDNNFTSQDKEIIFNAKNNKFGVINKSGEILDNLLSVHLKVKKNANVGKTKIALTDITSSDGEKKLNYDDSSVDVLIARDALEGEAVPINQNDKTQMANTKTNNDTNMETFSTQPIIIGLLIALFVMILLYIIINVLKLKNRKTFTIGLGTCMCLSTIAIFSLLFVNIKKKDVNNDGISNYDDAEEIVKYLINIEDSRPSIAETVKENDKDIAYNYENTNNIQEKNDSQGQNDNSNFNVELNSDKNEEKTNFNNVVDKSNSENTVKLNSNVSEESNNENDEKHNLNADIEYDNENKENDIEQNSDTDLRSNNENKENVEKQSSDIDIKSDNEDKENDAEQNLNTDKKSDLEIDKRLSDSDKQNDNNANSDNNLSDDDINKSDDNLNLDNQNSEHINDENSNQNAEPEVKQNDNQKENFDHDLNNDGNVDVADAAKQIQDTTKKTNYKVELTEIKEEDKYYISKNQQFTINFSATVTNNEKIEKVIIDGNTYPVAKNTLYYYVTLNTPNEAGVHEFNLSKVILSNKREVDVNLKIKKEILKDIPYIDMVSIDDEKNTLNFRLEDKDNALTKGTVTVKDDKGMQIINSDVKAENQFSQKFEEGVTYTILVNGTYDRDSNQLNDITGQKNLYENEELYVHTFKVLNNYDFQISNVTITDAIEIGQKPKITFDSTNNTESKVQSIVINNEEYGITLINGNHYEVILNKLDTSKFGKYYIDIDDVILDNLKSFSREKDYNINQLTYNVLKNLPTVSNINITENRGEKNVVVSYRLNDEDETLEKLNVVLVDSTDKIVDSKEIEKNKNELTLSYGNNTDGRYKVKFLADCNLGTDRHIYKDKNIGEEEILTQTDIYITNATVTTIYPKKSQPQYKVTYEVHVSDAIKQRAKEKNNVIYNVVSGITVNGLNYDADKTRQEYTSSISFTIPSESGVVDLEATRVQLQYEDYNRNIHEFFSVKPHLTQIDVLKDKPTIENFEILDEDYDSKIVTFQFDVVDDKGGFESGTIQLNNQSKPIQIGINTVTFENVQTDGMSDLKFYGNYDLDTNELPNEDENKNKYENDIIKTIPYGLYDKNKYDEIKLTNVKVVNNNNNEFFEKNENINLNFNVEGLDESLNLFVDKVIIENQEYKVENTDNVSGITIKGFNTAGEKDIRIEKIILNNGKKIVLTNPIEIKIEILKSPVTIKDFIYNIGDKNIDMEFALHDLDKSVNGNISQKVQVHILDEDGNTIKVLPYNNKIQIEKKENILRYYVKVLADYDRDSKDNNKNNYEDRIILDEVISTDRNNIELKDITDVVLYKEKDGNTITVEEVNVSDLIKNKNLYFVKITMAQMPTIHAKIKEVLEKDGRLILILDYKYFTKEKDNEEKDLRIDFGAINDGNAKNEVRPETLEQIIEKIKLDPSGNYKLKNDLDANNYTTEELSMINVIFTGTLDGNGYTIKNLKNPLFQQINGGTVENLKLEDIVMPSSNAQGSLANITNNAIIKNVLISRYIKKGSEGGTGSLIGTAENGTIIENCKVTNLDLGIGWPNQQVGGLVGKLINSTIKNSYANGKMDGGWNFRGALVGDIGGTSTIENCYTKVILSGGDGPASGLASVYSGKLIMKNNVILSTGFNNPITNSFQESENNYVLSNTSGESGKTGVTNITQEEVNESLFKNKAHFGETIWNLKKVSYDVLPVFNVEKTSKINIDEVKNEYDENKETLYNNLMLLMPFYDSKKIIKTAENIKEDNLLCKQEIMHIVPVDETGNIVTYLTSSNPQKITKIKIAFKNNEKVEYNVRYDNSYDMIASYRISDLKIDYTFNHYIIDSNSQLVNNLTNYLSGLTYEDNLDKLTQTADSRIYRDYYNDVTKHELKEFVLKYLSNTNYTNTTKNEVIDNYLEKEIKKDQKLEKLLYVYNYFKRFYSVDIDGIMLNDLILFDSQGFNQSMNPENIASIFLSNDNNFTLSRTNDAYRDTLSRYTNIETIPDLLEHFVTTLSTLTPTKWYANEFKGYLVEIEVPNRSDIMYTLWDHIKYKDTNNHAVWHNYALPLLTLPKNAAYIISTPTQFLIGAQRVYTKNPDSPEGQKELQDYVNKYTSRMQDYYTTAAGILNDSKYFNEIHTIQIDKRFTYDLNNNLVFQSPYQTQEPFHKNFNEVFNHWAHQDGNAATANGTVIFWRAEGALQGEWTYATWSHETAHNIDARLFLKNNGRRFDAGGEDYADNNLSQRFYESDITMNISKRYATGEAIGSNLVPERINTPVKIQDFYSKVFDTIYIMDYLEGQAFLKLSAEEQSKIAVQVSYPKEQSADKWYQKRNHTVYQQISKENFEAMNLESMEDLYKNKLVIYPGVIYSTYTENRYGGEGIYKARWYQPHNDEGRPDSYSIKWLAYEMLGYAGYDKGYIEYYSNINSINKDNINGYKTDLMALRKITNNANITFEQYKKQRFDYVKDNLKNIQIINVNEVFDEFYQALKQDAQYVKEVEEKAWQQYPTNSDSDVKNRNNMISKAKSYTNSTAVRRKIYYALKNGTNDFIGKVYDSNKTQEVNEFIVQNEVHKEFQDETLNEEETLQNEDINEQDTVLPSSSQEENVSGENVLEGIRPEENQLQEPNDVNNVNDDQLQSVDSTNTVNDSQLQSEDNTNIVDDSQLQSEDNTNTVNDNQLQSIDDSNTSNVNEWQSTDDANVLDDNQLQQDDGYTITDERQ